MSGKRFDNNADRDAAPPGGERQTGAGAGRRRERPLMVLMIVLAVIAVSAAVVTVLWSRWVVKPDLPAADPGAGAPTDGPAASDDPVQEAVRPLSTGERRSEDFYTVLIFGEDLTSGLTDTVMVASYDVTNQRATVMSIPRDLIYNSEGISVPEKMINSVYPRHGRGEKGLQALRSEVSHLVGFKPDYYVKINWEIVGQMVEAIDGVDFYIPWHMGYDDPVQDLHIHFEEGQIRLDGRQAMEVVRWRKNNDGVGGAPSSDISRLNLQHDFLKAVLKQTLQPQNVLKLPQLVDLFDRNVESDMTLGNMVWFAQSAVVGGLDTEDVTFTTMPYYGVDVKGAKYLYRVFPKQRELIALINESLNPYAEEVTIDQLDLISVSEDGNRLSSSTGRLKDPSAG